MIYKTWDIVIVPFPFVDSPNSKPRPALVISSEKFNQKNHHTVLAMITSEKNTGWRNDITIQKQENTGLRTPSVIRPKLFTLDNRLINRAIGKLHPKDLAMVKKEWGMSLF